MLSHFLFSEEKQIPPIVSSTSGALDFQIHHNIDIMCKGTKKLILLLLIPPFPEKERIFTETITLHYVINLFLEDINPCLLSKETIEKAVYNRK